MYSSEDLERFYFQYYSEALPHGESLQSFCVKNKVPHNISQKWFKNTKKVKAQIYSTPAPPEEQTKNSVNLNRHQTAVMTIPCAYGLTFV